MAARNRFDPSASEVAKHVTGGSQPLGFRNFGPIRSGFDINPGYSPYGAATGYQVPQLA